MSKPKHTTWMPFYVGDYLRKTSRLTTEQHGAYMLLILDYWTNGALPDDDTALAAITRLPLASWKKSRATIQAFFAVKDGKWMHDRIEDERMKAFAITEVRSMAGKASAARKADKHSTRVESHVQTKPSTYRPSNGQHTATPSPSPLKPSSIQSGLGGACVEDARPGTDAGPTKAGELANKLTTQLLERVAGRSVLKAGR